MDSTIRKLERRYAQTRAAEDRDALRLAQHRAGINTHDPKEYTACLVWQQRTAGNVSKAAMLLEPTEQGWTGKHAFAANEVTAEHLLFEVAPTAESRTIIGTVVYDRYEAPVYFSLFPMERSVIPGDAVQLRVDLSRTLV